MEKYYFQEFMSGFLEHTGTYHVVMRTGEHDRVVIIADLKKVEAQLITRALNNPAGLVRKSRAYSRLVHEKMARRTNERELREEKRQLELKYEQ